MKKENSKWSEKIKYVIQNNVLPNKIAKEKICDLGLSGKFTQDQMLFYVAALAESYIQDKVLDFDTAYKVLIAKKILG